MVKPCTAPSPCLRRRQTTKRSCRRHFPALFGASAASLRAFLAMNCLVLAAFVTTCLTNVGAYLANRISKVAVPRHQGRRHAANLRTVHVERNTARHHLDVLFLQA